MTKIKLDVIFVEWHKENNPHVFKKNSTKKEREKELTEYVNDVLQEHMEYMEKFKTNMNDLPEDNNEEG